MNRLTIQLQQSKQVRVGFSTGALSYLAKKIIKDHAKKLRFSHPLALELVWVSDRQIKALNSQYRKKNKATDVLSFSYLKEIDESGLIGQIIISTDTLRRQAEQQGHAYRTEAEVLFVHGVLHILGYDHETKKGFAKMLQLEQKYLGDKSGLVNRSMLE
jgi:probable rRNA maturation factor